MGKNSLQYVEINPNVRVIINSVEQYEVKYNVNLTAGGAFFENPGELGATHLMEHCMVGRTKDLDFKQLQDYIFENGVFMNAYTGRLSMDFIVSGHRLDAHPMLDLILQFSLKPTFDDDVLQQEKEIVLREISQHSGGTGYRLNKILLESMFEEGSFSRCEVLGSREDVKNTTVSLFQGLHNRMLQNSHIILTAVGHNIDIKHIESLLSAYKDAWQDKNNVLPINYLPENKLKKFKYLPVVSDLGHEHAVINIVIPCPVTLDNRPVRAYLRELLFQDPIGILYDRLRNEKGLIYSLMYSFDISSQTLGLELACEIEHIQSIIDEVKLVFSDFHKIHDDKVQSIRQLVLKRRELNEDNPDFVVNFTSNLLSDFGVIVNYEDYIQLVEQVTLDDIKALYDTICSNLEHMQVVVVSNKSHIKDLSLNI
jgi:predicted Zn-dependent peptidase